MCSHIEDSELLPKSVCHLRERRKPTLKLFSTLIWFAFFSIWTFFLYGHFSPDITTYLLWFTAVIFNLFLSHGTHELITKILWHTKKYIFFYLTKNRYNFDSFPPYSYCFVGCCHFLNMTI